MIALLLVYAWPGCAAAAAFQRRFVARGDAIERTVQTSPGPAGLGATYRQTRTIPRRGEENLQITVFEPPSRLTVHGQLGPFQATTSYLLQPEAIKEAVAGNLSALKKLLETGGLAGEGLERRPHAP